MATKIKATITKPRSNRRKSGRTSLEPLEKSTAVDPTPTHSKPQTSSLRLAFTVGLVILLGIGAYYLAKKYRGYIIAGSINTTPITRFELNKKLVERYGQATLQEMVDTALLADLAKKNNVTIAQSDLDEERKKIVDRLGGEEALKNALTQSGLTDKDFLSRLKAMVTEAKLKVKLFTNVEPKEDEVKKYFTDYSSYFKDKKYEDVKEEIKTNLKEQQLQDKFTEWFKDQRSKAQIRTYI